MVAAGSGKRERQGSVILGDAGGQVTEKFAEASPV
jgi:hypothetical protein